MDDDQRQVNPELLHRAQDEARQERMQRDVVAGRGGRRYRGSERVSRPSLVRRLDQANLLPAISFIFSRAG